MSKPTWKYKRAVNLLIYRMREHKWLVKIIAALFYYLRYLFRLGEKVKRDNTIEKVVSDNKKFIYMANPKVATRSLLKLLSSSKGVTIKIYHRSIEEVYAQNDERKNYFHFALVRNPWARVYSCWRDKISTDGKFCDIFIMSKFKGLYPDMPFSDFVHWLCTAEGSDNKADRHWLSQHEIFKGSFKVDKVIKIEELIQQRESLLTDIGLDPSLLQKENSTSLSDNDYQNFYDENLISLIAQRYKNDIKKFNYTFLNKVSE